MAKRSSPIPTGKLGSKDDAAARSTEPRNGRTISLIAVVLLVGAVWIVYGRAVDSPFIFDDIFSVTGNPSIKTLWPLVGDSEHPGPLNPPRDAPTSGRPLVNLSLALNYHFGQLNPAGYHAFNILMHILSALLLMAIVRRTLCLDYFGGRFESASGPLALVTALVWALHPLATETVIYITQRTELLVGFFYLATLYASLHYWAAESKNGRITWLAIATLACMAGMACKEVMVTAPIVVLLFERTFITSSFRRALRQSWSLYVGLAFGWPLLLWLNYSAPRSLSAGFQLGVSPFVWWLTQAKVLVMYLRLSFAPWPLTIHYEMPYLTTLGAAWPWLVLVAILVIGTVVLLWRRSAIGFVGAWILLILSPTLIVPIVFEMAAERRMYLPLAALVALVIVGIYALWQKSPPPHAARRSQPNRWPLQLTIAAGTLVLLAGIASSRRLAAYDNELTLWQEAVKYGPEDSVARNNLATILLKLGKPQEAIENCRQALRINPDYAQAHCNLGNALLSIGQTEEAIAEYEAALRMKPDYAEIQNNLGAALFQVGRKQEAIEHLRQALILNPKSPAEARFNLAAALVAVGQTQEGIENYQEAVRLKPNYTEAWLNLSQAYSQADRPKDAIAAAQKALEAARTNGQAALAQQIRTWLSKHGADQPGN